MPILYKVNSIAEAMLYYAGKANNERTKGKLTQLIKLHPMQKEILKAAAAPAIALEELLDSKLDSNKELVDKYFKKLENRYPTLPFGFCIAFIMIIYLLTNNLDYSSSMMESYLRESSPRERLYSMSFGLADKYESLYNDSNQYETFLRRVENSQFSYETKWKILDAAFNYQAHIEELLSLIMPAARLIETAEEKYGAAVEQFSMRYPNDNLCDVFETHFELKIGSDNCVKVAPLILGFDKAFVIYNSVDEPDENGTLNTADALPAGAMFLGIARHIINQSSNDELVTLSEKMQALSDRTRLEILFYLCSRRVYGQELCSHFGLQRSALSYHISKLLTAEFVIAEIDNGKTYYTADKAGIKRMVDDFVDRVKYQTACEYEY